jgi:hypothetical protein
MSGNRRTVTAKADAAAKSDSGSEGAPDVSADKTHFLERLANLEEQFKTQAKARDEETAALREQFETKDKARDKEIAALREQFETQVNALREQIIKELKPMEFEDCVPKQPLCVHAEQVCVHEQDLVQKVSGSDVYVLSASFPPSGSFEGAGGAKSSPKPNEDCTCVTVLKEFEDCVLKQLCVHAEQVCVHKQDRVVKEFNVIKSVCTLPMLLSPSENEGAAEDVHAPPRVGMFVNIFSKLSVDGHVNAIPKQPPDHGTKILKVQGG